MPTQDKVSQELEEMYGAGFDCGIEKSGDYHTIKFYLELINYIRKRRNSMYYYGGYQGYGNACGCGGSAFLWLAV